MGNNLLVNPFTTFLLSEGECQLIAPKPNSGLTRLDIRQKTHPDLYDLFVDLSKLRLDFLDIENDLNDFERTLLFENGVLVEKNKIPQKPLFSCQLNDVEASPFEADLNSLIVNPTLHFKPLDLGNFSSFVQDRNLLPYQPSVWIHTLISEIEIGYWLNMEETKIISQLKGGEIPLPNFNEEMLSKLVNAEILISPKTIGQRKAAYREQLQQAQRNFQVNKYAILQNLLPKHQMKAMRNYYRTYVRNGFMPFSDDQVKKRYYQHNEPLAKLLHKNLGNLMRLVSGKEVKPSYVYAASYEEGAILMPHTDRPQCEFSFSFQVDYTPTQNHISPWGLFVSEPSSTSNNKFPYISENFPAANQLEDTNNVTYLASGDALAYRGCDLIHYRYPLPADHKSTSLFFHYVPIDFDEPLI